MRQVVNQRDLNLEPQALVQAVTRQGALEIYLHCLLLTSKKPSCVPYNINLGDSRD